MVVNMKEGLAKALDTSPAAEAKQIELLRQVSPARRSAIAMSLSAQVLYLARRAISRAHPALSDSEQDMLFVEYNYGHDLAARLRAFLKSRHAK
jgi:hypothetical protein